MAIINKFHTFVSNTLEFRAARKEMRRMREILGTFDEQLGALFNSFALTDLHQLQKAMRASPEQFEIASQAVRKSIYDRYVRFRPC